ncbi:MAG: acetylglucosamine-6-sulfatase [Calditrichaeota bacterium]|nr:MAG: acetylglucosamine-6-sulfatase [Calditrichota bacterium]
MLKAYLIVSLIFLFSAAQPSLAQEASKPNFIFILTDDQSYDLLGCTGNEVLQTPNIDRLADEGMLFTNAHITSAICTPSRISIFLSQFERKHSVNFNSGTSVSEEAWEQSYPMVMRRAGYFTGYIGKNHSPVGEDGYKSGVMEKSFDYWYAGHGHLKFYPKKHHKIFKAAKANTQAEIIEEGMMDFFASNEHRLDGAIHFLDERPKDKPFMLSICFNLPHGAGTSTMKQLPDDPEIYKSLYRDKKIPLPEHYIAKADIKTPKLPPEIHRVKDRQSGYKWVDTPESVNERLTRMYQAMTGIDRLVGNLRNRLKELKIDENTVIVYSSDHGLFEGQHGLGGKALCYEKVTKVPMIIHDPRLPKSKHGKVSDALVQSIDIAPTILSMAGIDRPLEFQGKDLTGIVRETSKKVRDYLFTENLWSTQFGNPRCESIQNKEWKYIRYYKNENLPASEKIVTAKMLGMKINNMLYRVHDPDIAMYRHFIESPLRGEPAVYEELYHLAKDPAESINLIDKKEHKKILAELQTAWKEAITYARGEGDPKVLRYTVDSMAEKGYRMSKFKMAK